MLKRLNTAITHNNLFYGLLLIFCVASCGGGGSSPQNEKPASVNLTATPSIVGPNEKTTLNWVSTNTASCDLTNQAGTVIASGLSGTFTTTLPPSGSAAFTITCIGVTPGDTVSQTKTFAQVSNKPIVTLDATPSLVASGTSSTISWTSSNSVSCTFTDGSSYGAPTYITSTSGSFSTTPLAGPASFAIRCDGPAGSTTQSTTVWIGTCSTTGATGAISLPGVVASRYIGVAPLSVFFDATSATAPAKTSRPFHELEYRWEFGDPLGSPVSGSTWTTGSRAGVSSRNSATGPVTTHVYERPGTYTVALTVTDGTNTVSNNCTQITVHDPDVIFSGASMTGPNTICVGSTSTPTPGVNGCPFDALGVLQPDFGIAINSFALSGKQVLFRRGDTFFETPAGRAKIKYTGPGIVGAFGTASEVSNGIKPKIQNNINVTYDTPHLAIGTSNTPGIKDWRIMDLEFDGQNQLHSRGVYPEGGFDQFTFLRIHMHDIKDAMVIDGDTLNFINTPFDKGHKIFDQITIVDSTLTPIIGNQVGWRIFAFGQRLSIMGNTIGNLFDSTSMGSHVVRLPFVEKGMVSNNTIARSGNAALAMKLHGPQWCDASSLPGECLKGDGTALVTPTYSYLTNTPPLGVQGAFGGYSEQIVISDNLIIGAGSPYLVDVGPRNQYYDERVRDVIIERNFFQAGLENLTLNKATQDAVVLSGYDITARNNICDLTSGNNNRRCFNIKRYSLVSPARPPDNNRIINNTAFSGDASGTFSAVRVESGATNVVVKNNLAHAPSAATPPKLVDDSSGCGATCITTTSNSSDIQVKDTFPSWINIKIPSTIQSTNASDFSLAPGSYAIGIGTADTSALSDFFLSPRQQSGVPSTIDLGAIKGP